MGRGPPNSLRSKVKRKETNPRSLINGGVKGGRRFEKKEGGKKKSAGHRSKIYPEGKGKKRPDVVGTKRRKNGATKTMVLKVPTHYMGRNP